MKYKLELSDTFRIMDSNILGYGVEFSIQINEISESTKILYKYIMNMNRDCFWKSFINDDNVLLRICKFYNAVTFFIIDNNQRHHMYNYLFSYSLCIKDDTYLTSSTKIQLEIPSSITNALLWERI
jgi:hypothetical protein